MTDARDESGNPTGVYTAASPCIKVCLLDQENRCRGCGRTIDEIARWSTMTTDERIAINRRVGFVSTERNR